MFTRPGRFIRSLANFCQRRRTSASSQWSSYSRCSNRSALITAARTGSRGAADQKLSAMLMALDFICTFNRCSLRMLMADRVGELACTTAGLSGQEGARTRRMSLWRNQPGFDSMHNGCKRVRRPLVAKQLRDRTLGMTWRLTNTKLVHQGINRHPTQLRQRNDTS